MIKSEQLEWAKSEIARLRELLARAGILIESMRGQLGALPILKLRAVRPGDTGYSTSKDPWEK